MASGVQWRVACDHLEVLQVYHLLHCVRGRDQDKIRKLLRLGVPNILNLSEPREGQSALHLACEAPDTAMVEFLLSQGALPGVQDNRGRTPVMMAAALGRHSHMVLLAERQASMEVVDHQGKGVLFYCLPPTQDHQLCLQVALNHGADTSNMSAAGEPVLVASCRRPPAWASMALSLLDHGADPNAASQATGRTALMEACCVGAVGLARDLLQWGGDPNSPDKQRMTAAHLAAGGGFFEVLVLLSAYGADLGCAALDLRTPLHMAAAGGFTQCCRFLAQRGCNTRQKNVDGLRPRQVATDKATSKVLRRAETLQGKLSKPGAVDPNAPWKLAFHDWSCEHRDALCSDMSAAEDPHAPLGTVAVDTFCGVMEDHRAPLDEDQLHDIVQEHTTEHVGGVDLGEFFQGVRYLQKSFTLRSFAPKPAKAKQAGKGRSRGPFAPPMPICVLPEPLIGRRAGLPQFMIEKCQPPPAPDPPLLHPIQDDRPWYMDQPDQVFVNIHYCAMTSDLESLSLALNQGVPVDVQDRYFQTLLMTACSSANLEVAEFLVSMGADVNARDQFGWTPLHRACQAGQLGAVELLVGAGAEVDAAALNGATPLMRAIASPAPRCVEYLISAGADVLAETKHGQNCLALARALGEDAVVDMAREKVASLHKNKEHDGKRGGSSATAQHGSPEQVQKAPPREDLRVLSLHRIISSGKGFRRDISFAPRLVRGRQATAAQLIDRRKQRRELAGSLELSPQEEVSETVRNK